uniref:Pinin_SDK_memA domain-containing protein n=1 Tax=Syphacia muris TaxID=451379 RepID=A0A0N5AK05_9BILA
MALENLNADISKAFEDLRSIEDSITALGRNERFGGVRRRFSDGQYENFVAERHESRMVNYGGGPGPINKRRLVISADNDLYDGPGPGKRLREDIGEEETYRTVQSSVVMPTIETKSREAAINELKGQEKREVSVRNRRMFSNLLLGTLQRFQKEEKKVSSTERVQAEKQREVERRLKETEMEEKERIAKERMELIEKRREKEHQIKALQRKKAIIQYAQQKLEHLRKLKNFIQTQAKPSIFYLPSKHTLRTLELLKNTNKLMDDRIEHRRRQMEEELKTPEERDKKSELKEDATETNGNVSSSSADQQQHEQDLNVEKNEDKEIIDENASGELKKSKDDGTEKNDKENELNGDISRQQAKSEDEEQHTANLDEDDNGKQEDKSKVKQSGKVSDEEEVEEEVRKSTEEGSERSRSSDED